MGTVVKRRSLESHAHKIGSDHTNTQVSHTHTSGVKYMKCP